MSSEVVTGEVTGLAFGGLGIVRWQGQVIFVPYTAPGDTISCSITKAHKNFAKAKLLSIHKASPVRMQPRCPYFGTCGGCQLQHVNDATQLEYKQQSVKDALKRIGGCENADISPTVPATRPWAYRRHITLTLQEKGGRFQIGYVANDNESLVSVTECPIFLDAPHPLLQDIQQLVHTFEAIRNNSGKLLLVKVGEGFFLQWHFKTSPSNALEQIQKAHAKHPDWIGSGIASPHGIQKVGRQELHISVDGLNMRFSPLAFIQNHPEQSVHIYRTIVRLALEAKARRVLDFYCGIGISSLLLAREGISVVGIENNREAIKLAQENSAKNGYARASFICADAKIVAKRILEEIRPDCVLLNPPRTGLDKQMLEAFKYFQPATILYISCMPSTLARDIAQLTLWGYRLEKATPVDMFPQTAHVETIVLLKKG